MIAYVIKFNNGTFYAGCNKPNAKTLLGAQLYKSEKTAINVINKSVNFHATLESCFLVKVKLEEIKPMKTIEEIRQELHKQGYDNVDSMVFYTNDFLHEMESGFFNDMDGMAFLHDGYDEIDKSPFYEKFEESLKYPYVIFYGK